MRLACICRARKPEARTTLWRDVIREAMIELPCRLLHLLTQKIKGGDFFGAGVISVNMDVVADGVCGPKSVNAARDQEIFRCNALEEFLRISEELARFFSHLWVVEDRRVTATQFPRMKKWRPVDVRNKIAHFDLFGSARRWRAHLGRWPRCFLRGIPYPRIIFTRPGNTRVPRISRNVVELFL